MNEQALLCERNNRFQGVLQSTIGYFRNGEDLSGFNDFLICLEDLECIINTYQYLGGQEIDFDKMLPAVRELLACIRNQDVTGMTDLLEFTIYPLSKEWMKGCDQP